MKYLLSVVTFLFLSFVAKSQLDKGTWLVGGTGSFYSYDETFNTSTYNSIARYNEIDLSPTVGYFAVHKLTFGLRPTFSSIKGKVTTTGGLRTNVQRYWLGPFARYYLLDKDHSYNLLLDVRYQLGISTLDGKKTGNLETFGASAGPVLYFNSAVGLEFLLGYSYTKVDEREAIKNIRKGFQASVGFQIHLAKD